jgi:hypothetical protein
MENTFPKISFIASYSCRNGPHGEHRFPVTPLLCVTGLLPSNERVCRAIPKQRLSLLASQFLPWANMPQYILCYKVWWVDFLICCSYLAEIINIERLMCVIRWTHADVTNFMFYDSIWEGLARVPVRSNRGMVLLVSLLFLLGSPVPFLLKLDCTVLRV